MADDTDTFEIQLDTVGAEAVQQTLDALGVHADEVNHAAAAAEETGSPGSGEHPPSDAAAAVQIDLSEFMVGIIAAQEQTNSLLEEILAAIQEKPVTQTPTY